MVGLLLEDELDARILVAHTLDDSREQAIPEQHSSSADDTPTYEPLRRASRLLERVGRVGEDYARRIDADLSCRSKRRAARRARKQRHPELRLEVAYLPRERR